MTKDEFKTGVLFLLKVKNDYQLDLNSPDHCGFLACGEEITDDPGFQLVANNPEEFSQVIDGLGLDTEEGIHLEDTVFILK